MDFIKVKAAAQGYEKAMTASLTRGVVQRDESGFFNQTELTQKLEIAGTKHQLLYGLELGRQSKDLLSYSRANVATVSLLPFKRKLTPR